MRISSVLLYSRVCRAMAGMFLMYISNIIPFQKFHSLSVYYIMVNPRLWFINAMVSKVRYF